MKAAPALLVASLALNGVLVFALRGGAANGARPVTESSITPSAHAAAPDVTALARAAEDFKRNRELPPLELRRWLEAAGVPPLERSLIEGDAIMEHYERGMRAILGAAAAPENPEVAYWKMTFTEPKTREQTLALEKLGTEMYAMLRETERAAFPHDARALDLARRRFGDLPVEKLVAIQKAVVDADLSRTELFNRIRERPGGTPTPEEQVLLESHRRAVMDHARSTLTAPEFAEFELHHGDRATQLRQMLGAFQPTEEEFLSIHALYREADTQSGTGRADATAEIAAEAKIKELLGEDRFADFAQAKRGGGDVLNRLVARLNLPLRTAATLTDVRTTVTAQAQAIRQNNALTIEQRDAALAALADEATHTLTSTLGHEGFTVYEDIKGEWLRALRPKPGKP